MNNFEYENLYQYMQYDNLLRRYEHFNICKILYTKILKGLCLSYCKNKTKVTSGNTSKGGNH